MNYDIEIDKYGNKRYYKHNTFLLHREDGPAVEFINGDKYWYQNGLCHRLDGPAAEHNNGAKEWYQNNQLHRLDGPAIEYADGMKEYFINDIQYSEKDYWYIVNNNLHILL